jgi:hypothetical protein
LRHQSTVHTKLEDIHFIQSARKFGAGRRKNTLLNMEKYLFFFNFKILRQQSTVHTKLEEHVHEV